MARFPLMIIGLSATIGLSACSMDDSRYKKAEYTQASNPAAVYCVQQDGKLETVTDNGKRVTYCSLPDGKKVEQWEYYLNRNKKMDDTTN